MADSPRKLQVFVSSTYKDMEKERQAIVEAILAAGHIPAGMELFVVNDTAQWETIERWILDCDLVVVLAGSRYGAINPRNGKSFVESEHDYAVEQGKPVFRYVFSDNFLNEKIKSHGTDAIDDWVQAKRFVEKLRHGKMCAAVEDIKDLKREVERSLSKFALDNPRMGWVKGHTSALKMALNANANSGGVTDMHAIYCAERIANTRLGIFDLFDRAQNKIVLAAQNHYWYAGNSDRQIKFADKVKSFLSQPHRRVSILINDIEDKQAVRTWTKTQVQGFPDHLQKTTDYFRTLMSRAHVGGDFYGLEVRAVPLVPFSVNFVDPDDDDGFLILTPNAYEVESMSRPCFLIEKKSELGIFNAYWSSFSTKLQDVFSRPIQ